MPETQNLSNVYEFGSLNPSFLANNEYNRQINSGLIDPTFNNVLTSNPQKSSSNSSCNSIGLSDSDDDNSSLDDHFNNNEKLPLCLSSRKWITTDGYNLSTFNQTEGIWSLEHPLPLPTWANESKKPFNIEKVSHLSNSRFRWKRTFSCFPYL